jgi:hypothetical protein
VFISIERCLLLGAIQSLVLNWVAFWKEMRTYHYDDFELLEFGPRNEEVSICDKL